MSIPQTDHYCGIDKNEIKDPVAYCHYIKHRGFLTPSMMKTHGCLRKQCRHLEKIEEHPHWEARRQRKQSAKRSKQELMEKQL